MDELQERAAEFIRIEDMRISQKKLQKETFVGGENKEDKRSFDDNDTGGDPRLKGFPRKPKFIIT